MIYFLLESLNKNLQISDLKLEFSDELQEPRYNKLLYNYLNNSKTMIDNYVDQWDLIKKFTNPFEFIHTIVPGHKTCISKINPLSRAFFKMIEICNIFKLCENKNTLSSFHIAEGPGGFIQAISYLRNNNKDSYYGITLEEDNKQTPGWKKTSSFLEKNKNVFIERGIDNTGNLYNPETFKYMSNKYKNSFDILTGDGGFDFSSNFNQQENNIIRLLYTEICYAIMLQKNGGHFVLKIFDLFLKSSIDIIYILSLCYKEVYICKPSTSRSANSEKYVVCKNFYLIPSEKEKLLITFYRNLQILEINKNKNIKNILKIDIQESFINDIKEINSILGQNQLENINSTIMLIEQCKKKEKLNSCINQNIPYCIEWCKNNNIPYHDKVVENNVFISN
jgi:cap1 methyltransferase